LSQKLLLGSNILIQHQATISYEKKTLTLTHFGRNPNLPLRKQNLTYVLDTKLTKEMEANLRPKYVTSRRIYLPKRTEIIIPLKLVVTYGTRIRVRPNLAVEQKYGILIPRAILSPSALVRVINPYERKIILPRHIEIGHAQQLYVPRILTCNIVKSSLIVIGILRTFGFLCPVVASYFTAVLLRLKLLIIYGITN